MPTYYLAIDIGASSGRHILGSLENGKIKTEEIYRFSNGLNKVDGHLCWDIESLKNEVVSGIKKCKEIGKIPATIGIDTWGVDFALLDSEDKLIGNVVGYRDSRTNGMDKAVNEFYSDEELYYISGIQKQKYNTIYQLMALKKQNPEQLEKAETLLMVPEYLTFVLTGTKNAEYTNCTTAQLVDPVTKDWNFELIDKLGYPRKIFQKICKPGTVVGPLSDAVAKEVGFTANVVLPATHDTGSAVVAVPVQSDAALYISSGTWSLLGTEIMEANCTEQSRMANLTNEGGYDYRFRYLKNIMGLWMLQSVKKEWDNKYSFDDICKQAMAADIDSIVNCQDDMFLAPNSMIEAVKTACAESGQKVPQTVGEIAAVIYNSLAVCYKNACEEIEALTGQKYDTIHIVGGGSKDEYLNNLTAKYTGKTVVAGPSEATAIGNLAVQMIANGDLKDLKDARRCIADSTKLTIFQK